MEKFESGSVIVMALCGALMLLGYVGGDIEKDAPGQLTP